MPPVILALNAGSSSLKFALYELSESLPLLVKGSVASLNANPRLRLSGGGEPARQRDLGAGPLDSGSAVEIAADEIRSVVDISRLQAVGHRIVHGGWAFTSPAFLDDDVVEELRRLIPLAPIHQPQNLEIVDRAKSLFPGAAQVGCFDTAFHAGRPAVARAYGLPRELSESGIQSYGFHGLSYAYISSELRKSYGPPAGGKVIVAHLGSGASLCAMLDGKSVATTMGFSPLDGLVMSTRCGALDPGVVLYLLQERGMRAEEVARLLYHQSGLLGISGITGDMQRLLQSDSPEARGAVDAFVYRAGREIGSLAAALGGLDMLVFTAGIGENSPAIRELIGAAAKWLGVQVDPDLNLKGEPSISTPASKVRILVMPTDEEVEVAREALRLLQGNESGHRGSPLTANQIYGEGK
ncbi:acetate/propionate family kinase [Neoaquamicrobium sediminum]|uniref:Acetate kinase n=1 Tax=Neoaquamicrobium sediminum TaxID=1849104 RepID=A0ABV3X135_9HYPH|nr:acetate/propionate family kinase [Mesorhizobium sediminum]MBX3584591.1 acetate/propionate family kinase [Rhizobiaceae bacterium]NRC56394.1 acetate/propionate family kinase [Mesorhizobium sediminum]